MNNKDKQEFFDKFEFYNEGGYARDIDVWEWIESKKKEWQEEVIDGFYKKVAEEIEIREREYGSTGAFNYYAFKTTLRLILKKLKSADEQNE